MKKLLIIDGMDLSAIKGDLSLPFLQDKLIEAEVDLDIAGISAIVEMVEAFEEQANVVEEDYDYESDEFSN